MPPKKKITEQVTKKNDIDLELSESEEEVVPETPKKTTKVEPKPMLITSNASDNSRIKLANAINNLTIKSDEFMATMKNFDTFRESIIKLDIEIETKKKEYNELLTTLDQNQKNRLKELDLEFNDKHKELTNKYSDMTKSLQEKYQDSNKKLDTEYHDKNINLQNEFKNNQISVNQRLAEFKIKACEEFAKSNNMVLIKEDAYQTLNLSKQKAIEDYEDLKKRFDTECNSIRKEEQTKYATQLKNEMSIFELTNKAQNADIKAQVEQQKREIEVLHNTIVNLKNELVEQRNLTKDVAQASAKSQITQKFGKE